MTQEIKTVVLERGEAEALLNRAIGFLSESTADNTTTVLRLRALLLAHEIAADRKVKVR